jgi:hypothetical protein
VTKHLLRFHLSKALYKLLQLLTKYQQVNSIQQLRKAEIRITPNYSTWQGKQLLSNSVCGTAQLLFLDLKSSNVKTDNSIFCVARKIRSKFWIYWEMH